MRRLYNLTAHCQSKFYFKYRELGWDVEEQARIKRVAGKGSQLFENLTVEAKRAGSEIPAQSHCLIGGAQVLVDTLALELLSKDCHLYVGTSYEIKFVGSDSHNITVIETPLSKWFHGGKNKTLKGEIILWKANASKVKLLLEKN
jgi:hypothetical protein